jgi:hypothetical protein
MTPWRCSGRFPSSSSGRWAIRSDVPGGDSDRARGVDSVPGITVTEPKLLQKLPDQQRRFRRAAAVHLRGCSTAYCQRRKKPDCAAPHSRAFQLLVRPRHRVFTRPRPKPVIVRPRFFAPSTRPRCNEQGKSQRQRQAVIPTAFRERPAALPDVP